MRKVRVVCARPGRPGSKAAPASDVAPVSRDLLVIMDGLLPLVVVPATCPVKCRKIKRASCQSASGPHADPQPTATLGTSMPGAGAVHPINIFDTTRQSPQMNLQPMRGTIIYKPQAERSLHDDVPVDGGEGNAPANAIGIFDPDLVSCRTVSKRHLEACPCPGDVRIEMQDVAVQTQPENTLHASALHPSS